MNLFSLNKFRKNKRDDYDDKEECLKTLKKYNQTNPRFKLFDQSYFHAGDIKDILKYGLLPLQYFYSIEKPIHKSTPEKIFKLYKKIDYESIFNTFKYMFFKFKKGVFVIIHDNKLVLYLPFSNANYTNDWYKQTYFSEEEKHLMETKPPNEIKNKLIQNIIEFQKKYPDQYSGKKRKINFRRDKWVANNCFFRNQFPEYEGDQNVNIYKSMLIDLLKHRTVPDVEFFINVRDFPILKTDYTEPYEHLFDSEHVKIQKEFQFKKMCPIFSKSCTDKFADMLIPNEDDWRRVSNKLFREKCANDYRQNAMDKINLVWKSKKPVCIFRGSATGCGITLETNMRLKASDISLDYPDILDAGITNWNAKPKKYMNKPITIIDTSKFRFKEASFISNAEKSDYKYILNIDGHVSACRLSSELGMNSVVLVVDSSYKLWFSNMIEPYVHYVPVKHDLSDLISQIQWCIDNDKKCKKIAETARQFYLDFLSKDGVFNYLQKELGVVASNKNDGNLLGVKKSKKNIAVISCYRDSKDGSRDKQRKFFIQVMKEILKPYCDFHIFIIEQSQDGNAFNIGKLKNIGYEIANDKANSKKFDHFIFTDIDMIPDYDLLPYYVKTPKFPISLASHGTRYENLNKKIHKPFVGGVMSFSKKIFEDINGYPNNFWGWGGEDDSLLIRLHSIKNVCIYYPEKGQVIDIEEDDKMKTIDLENKLKGLEKNTLKVEKWLIDINDWKNNGLSNLNYRLINTDEIDPHVTQYTVDLLKKIDEEKYPTLYPDKFSNNKTYMNAKTNIKKITHEIPIKPL